jgi:hypothetical protein
MEDFMKKLCRITVVLFAIACLTSVSQINAQNKGPKSTTGHGNAKAGHKMNAHDGKQLLGDKIKTNGNHVLDKKGDYTTSVEVKDGKIAGVHVKHAKNGDVPVIKYKTHTKVVQNDRPHYVYASLRLAQDQYLGTEYIGYAYVDEYGYVEIYWFPYDIILDGDTGAIEYIPAY